MFLTKSRFVFRTQVKLFLSTLYQPLKAPQQILLLLRFIHVVTNDHFSYLHTITEYSRLTEEKQHRLHANDKLYSVLDPIAGQRLSRPLTPPPAIELE